MTFTQAFSTRPSFDSMMPSSLKPALLLAALLQVFLMFFVPPAFAEKAGSIEFVTGEAYIRDLNDTLRSATKGMLVEAGETIETTSGRVQLRMIDEAYISLQPQTTFQIQEYAVPANGREEKGFLKLLKGGLRTITGLVGHINRPAYRLSTPTATIGIRGTEFGATADDSGTRVSVAGGIVALCTDGGCIDIHPGQSGFAPSKSLRPTLSFEPAILPPVVADAAPAFVMGDQRGAEGQPAILSSLYSATTPSAIPVIPIATGTVSGGLAIAYNTSTGFTAEMRDNLVTFATSGALTGYLDPDPDVGLIDGLAADFGADGIIAWGRWTGGESLHLLLSGIITNLTYYSTLTSLEPSVTSIIRGYASFASTAPVATEASGAINYVGIPNSVTGTLSVNFSNPSSGGVLAYSLKVPVGGQTFSINGEASQIYGSYGFLGTSSTISSTGSGCYPVCSGTIPYGNAIQGNFTGPNAERAGANYGFSSSIGNVSGTVVFK